MCNDGKRKLDYIDRCTIIDKASDIFVNQSISETADITNNTLLIDQLKTQNDEASQLIIHLEHEHNANLNKVTMMLSAIEQMESKIYCMKQFMKTSRSSSGRRWKNYYAKVRKMGPCNF
ncbi:uncharacterized protein LOC105197621 [Solenopsis invicta]|uniref:uncharacterized protein LOC105197621 n=1 Tax=Solenopsis invicta TaxID=13686 RepID=UPI00059605F4|nr:uncharacterized protein LOC105197621 [Solenopsis invicta]